MKGTIRFLLFAFCALIFLTPSFGQLRVGVAVSFGPPAIPIYDQPLCPGDGYLWVPGYWSYDDADGYYWVPGTWVMAPEPGFLWTPGWWGWEDTGFFWHEGFWGPEVGFYGGVNYGFGYFGTGFVGGRWDGGHFFYNRAVLNIDVTNIHNVYNTRVENVNENRVSYNGGEGGITRRPTPQEQEAAQRRHVPPVAEQTQHEQAARSNPQMRAETNQGRPPIAATSRPGAFAGQGVVAARNAGAPYKPAPVGAGGARPGGGPAPEPGGTRPGGAPEPGRPAEGNPIHAGDLQSHQVTPAPSSGDAKADQAYQKQQQKMIDQQNKEHQKLAQQQQKEDEKAATQNQNDQQKQLIEQHHQQQTQSMEQRHTQQQQQMQMRAPAPRSAPAPQQRR